MKKPTRRHVVVSVIAVAVFAGGGLSVAAATHHSDVSSAPSTPAALTPTLTVTPSSTPMPSPTPTPSVTLTPSVAESATDQDRAPTSQATTPASQVQAPRVTTTASTPKPVSTGLGGYVAQSPSAGETNQILGVVATGSYAQIHLFEKQSDGTWSDALDTSGRVGSAGVGTASESSTATPRGSWPLLSAFGIAANPGSLLPWRQVDQGSCYISDISDVQYNTWQERSTCNDPDEQMITESAPYQYGMVIGYNTARTPGAGSAFFVHVDDGAATSGCVSVPQPVMVQLLQTLHSGARIVNVTSAPELADY